jgi:hypothetical protein
MNAGPRRHEGIGKGLLVACAVGAVAVLALAASLLPHGVSPKDFTPQPWTIAALSLQLAAWIGSIYVWWRAGDRGIGHWLMLPILALAGAAIGPLVILLNVGWFGRPDVFREAVA